MEKPGKVFYLFYFISFALKNTKKHCEYANKILGQGHRNI